MGYYSNVKIICEEKAFLELKPIFMKENNYLRPDAVEKLHRSACGDGSVFTIGWDYIKWYKDFNGVHEFMKKLSEFSGLDGALGYGYYFVRVGEDIGDVEVLCNDTDLYLDVDTRVETPYESTPVNIDSLREDYNASQVLEDMKYKLFDNKNFNVDFTFARWDSEDSFSVKDSDGNSYCVSIKVKSNN